jgi:hypothetical protein
MIMKWRWRWQFGNGVWFKDFAWFLSAAFHRFIVSSTATAIKKGKPSH